MPRRLARVTFNGRSTSRAIWASCFCG